MTKKYKYPNNKKSFRNERKKNFVTLQTQVTRISKWVGGGGGEEGKSATYFNANLYF